MPARITVAKIQEVPPGTGKVVKANGKEIALFNLKGTFYALSNFCLHEGGPLGEGSLEEGEDAVVCPWHGWMYKLATGECLVGTDATVPTFPVFVDGDEVKVEI